MKEQLCFYKNTFSSFKEKHFVNIDKFALYYIKMKESTNFYEEVQLSAEEIFS